MSDDKKPDEIVKFPTLKERDRIAHEKREAENAKKKKGWGVSYKKQTWKSGDGSPVGPRSSGNGGVRPREPFLNVGNIPPFVKFVAVAMVVIHLVMAFILPKDVVWDVRMALAFIPGVFTGSEPMVSMLSLLSPFTHMFFHADWMHVILNAIMLLAFGMFVEKRLGSKVAAFFFLAGGLFGALLYLILNPGTSVQLLGASSGISALFGVAMLAMHAERSGAMGNLMAGSPWKMVGLWTAIMVGLGLMGGGDIAWQAHVGGFLSGVFLYRQMQKGRLRI